MQSLVRCRSSSRESVPRAAASSYDASVSSGMSPGTPRCPMTKGCFPSRVRKRLEPAGAEAVCAQTIDVGTNAKAAAPNSIAPTLTLRRERHFMAASIFLSSITSNVTRIEPNKADVVVFLSQFSDRQMTAGPAGQTKTQPAEAIGRCAGSSDRCNVGPLQLLGHDQAITAMREQRPDPGKRTSSGVRCEFLSTLAHKNISVLQKEESIVSSRHPASLAEGRIAVVTKRGAGMQRTWR